MGKVHASLFSGFGAGDLAATWMGWENAFWCEIDPFCQTVLGYHFPKSSKYENIKETDFTPWHGKIDVLTGGFPCQPFSVAGQRKGQDDDRYLWPEMLRAIREIRPTWVIGENVGGILSMVQPGSEITVESQTSLFEEADKETILDQDSVVGTVCRDLEQEGYSVHPIVIPACAVGAPHRRDRIFFIAHCPNAGAEGLQREGKDGVYRSEITSNTNSHDAGRSGHEKAGCTKGKDETTNRQWERVRTQFERTCTERSIADPDGIGCYNRGDHRQERSVYHNEERNAQEDQSERTERKCRAGKVGPDVANTHGKRLQTRFWTGRWTNKAEIRARLDNGTERSCCLWYAPYAHQFNGNLSGLCSSRIPQFEASGVRIDTNTYNKRFAEQRPMSESDKPGFSGGLRNEAGSRSNWQNFPTQPPVCRGNDGLPFDVVRLTVSFTAWRTGSVKGYGNAIVPQVMYEIFKAIEESEK